MVAIYFYKLFCILNLWKISLFSQFVFETAVIMEFQDAISWHILRIFINGFLSIYKGTFFLWIRWGRKLTETWRLIGAKFWEYYLIKFFCILRSLFHWVCLLKVKYAWWIFVSFIFEFRTQKTFCSQQTPHVIIKNQFEDPSKKF